MVGRLLAAVFCLVLLAVTSAGAEVPEAPAPQGFAFSWEPLLRTWKQPARNLQQRVDRARAQALRHGVENLEPVARALLRTGAPETALRRAEAAVQLAPELPAAHMRVAELRWEQKRDVLGTAAAWKEALFAIPQHPVARFWFQGVFLRVLSQALIVGSLLFLLLVFARRFWNAAHDLGDATTLALPEPARWMLLVALCLLPVALGQALFGGALFVSGVAFLYGRVSERRAVVAAAVLLWLAIYPALQISGRALAAPLASAPLRALLWERGDLLPPVHFDDAELSQDSVTKLQALQLRRSGEAELALERYRTLREDFPESEAIANNTANLLVEQGQLQEALSLYEQAAVELSSPRLMFNLAEAYAQEIRLLDHDRILALAQGLDEDLMTQFTHLKSVTEGPLYVDVSLFEGAPLLVPGTTAGDAAAKAMREPLGSGFLGATAWGSAIALALVLWAAKFFRKRFRISLRCAHCGLRKCPRCDGATRAARCAACRALAEASEAGSESLRRARLQELRQRERRLHQLSQLAGVCLPGFAGLWAGSGSRALAACVLFACGVCFLSASDIPDPLLLGSAAPLALTGFAAVAWAAYALLLLRTLLPLWEMEEEW